MRTRAAVLHELHAPWSIEEIEIATADGVAHGLAIIVPGRELREREARKIRDLCHYSSKRQPVALAE